jgi:hypothetical protein
MLPAQVLAFRGEYRAKLIGPRYSGALHFAFTSVGSLAVIGFALSQVRDPTPAELLTLPLTFLLANFVEYRGHEGPMHRAWRPLALLFERHTLQHHRFFTHEAMGYESPRDYKMVLFPPVMLLFFLGAIGLPIGAVLFRLASSNVALLYLASAMGYFLTYEWLHFCHHLPEASWTSRVGVLRALRRHHQAHHDPARMTRWNFNITFPVCDALFRTRWRERTPAPAAALPGSAPTRH